MRGVNHLWGFIKLIVKFTLAIGFAVLIEFCALKTVNVNPFNLNGKNGTEYIQNKTEYLVNNEEVYTAKINDFKRQESQINYLPIDELEEYKLDVDNFVEEIKVLKDNEAEDTQNIKNAIKSIAVEGIRSPQSPSLQFSIRLTQGEKKEDLLNELTPNLHYTDVLNERILSHQMSIDELNTQENEVEPIALKIDKRIQYIKRALNLFPGAKGAYIAGQCTWGAYLWREHRHAFIKKNWGNAMDWAGNAKEAGYLVNDRAEEGAVAVFGPNSGNLGYGHVAIVQSVNQENHTIQIWEMNYSGPFSVNVRQIPINRPFAYIHGPSGLTLDQVDEIIGDDYDIDREGYFNKLANSELAKKFREQNIKDSKDFKITSFDDSDNLKDDSADNGDSSKETKKNKNKKLDDAKEEEKSDDSLKTGTNAEEKQTKKKASSNSSTKKSSTSSESKTKKSSDSLKLK